MGWIIGIGIAVSAVVLVWLVVYCLNRDMWEDVSGLGDFIDMEDEKDETSGIDEDKAE